VPGEGTTAAPELASSIFGVLVGCCTEGVLVGCCAGGVLVGCCAGGVLVGGCTGGVLVGCCTGELVITGTLEEGKTERAEEDNTETGGVPPEELEAGKA